MAAKKKAADPFSTKKTATKSSTKVRDMVVPEDSAIQMKVDEFVVLKGKEKEVKNALEIAHKDLKKFALNKFCERVLKENNTDGFDIEGIDLNCKFIMKSNGVSKSEAELATFTETYGEKAADALFIEDNASIRLNGQYLADNFERIVALLQKVLTPSDFAGMFSSRSINAAPNAIENAPKFAKKPEDLAALYREVGLTHYCQAPRTSSKKD